MRRSLRAWLITPLLATVSFVAACASPPNKEMDQAQGAIDAARAAGAETFAATEFTAATTALQRAHDAVAQRDYRLALNNALEGREHAQNAARDAADARVRLRDEYRKAFADLGVQLAAATARFNTTQSRMPRAAARELQQALAQVSDDVQKAGAALESEDYTRAQPVFQALRARITEIVAGIDRAGLQSARRRS